jgi:hypothetical protein
MNHYHIRWSEKDSLDWESFRLRTEADARARQLMRPGESYTIEELDAGCLQCRTRFKSTTLYERQEPYLNPKHSSPKLKYPWQKEVLEALVELHAELLPLKISGAERAISARLGDGTTPPDLDEQLAIRDALQSLGVLLPKRSEPKSESERKEEVA